MLLFFPFLFALAQWLACLLAMPKGVRSKICFEPITILFIPPSSEAPLPYLSMNQTELSLHPGIYRPFLSEKFVLDIFDLLDYIGMTKIGVLF